ncbi:hypothetical protein, partial [Pseudomonas sp. FSL R10-0071]|uniref:hypothetical protein n=1 Tax=Pseudomonas sp. FSL R10-0071 TaxID=2662193 RepID=UPI001C49A396
NCLAAGFSGSLAHISTALRHLGEFYPFSSPFLLRSHALSWKKAQLLLDLEGLKHKNPDTAVQGLPEADPLSRS